MHEATTTINGGRRSGVVDDFLSKYKGTISVRLITRRYVNIDVDAGVNANPFPISKHLAIGVLPAFSPTT